MTNNNKFNNMITGNVKIKIEPGTSRFSDNVNIKIEPGSSARLTSLKLPRDLKLGGSKSKSIKPNLNVVRNKQGHVNSPSQNNRGRGRGRGRFDRGRGAPRNRSSNIVQSEGIFSGGFAEPMRRPREPRESVSCYSSAPDSTMKVMERPTIKKDVEWKIDKEHEDLVMKDILSIHIEPDDPDAKQDLHPIFLPINKLSDLDRTMKFDKIVKTENSKPVENGITEKVMFEKNEKLFLFQFPDTLPGIGAVVDPERDAKLRNSGNATNTNNEKSTDTEKIQTQNKCTLQDVNEGLLGKIVIYKSGKTKLVLGNNRFDVEMGPSAGFLQDVMSVPVNTTIKSGDMINLGSLEGNVIVTPEWNHLLYSSE